MKKIANYFFEQSNMPPNHVSENVLFIPTVVYTHRRLYPPSYEDRLKRVKWPTLEKRRTLSSLTECYKTINGLNCLNPHEFFNFADKYRPLRSNHRFKLKMKSAKLNCYKHSFFLRIVNLWNNLRKETAEAKDLRTFRNKLVNEFS